MAGSFIKELENAVPEKHLCYYSCPAVDKIEEKMFLKITVLFVKKMLMMLKHALWIYFFVDMLLFSKG